ncbi:MAG: hypothetical protein ACT4PN_08980 [Nitrospiraceae bacterium]
MAYKPLAIDRATPPRVKALIRALESHYLSDVHTMLRLPDVSRDLVAGCNFAITQVLAAAVSGISVTLYSHNGGSGIRFKGLLKDYYPWALEPGNAVTPQDGANVLYSVIRNPLTHDLGLDLENKRQGQKIVIKRLATDNNRKGLPEHFIEQLESRNRPSPMSPTVRVLSGKTVVLVEGFYWGVRQMVEQLSGDASCMHSAETFLGSI